HHPGNGTDATGIGRKATTMQRRFLLILVCASVLGLLASALVYRVVSQIASAGSGQYEPIVVAAVNMSLAETITSQHVKLVPWPKTSVPEGAIRTVQDAEGRAVRSSILAGEPLIQGKLAPGLAGKGGIMPMLVPEGQRGVTIKLDEAVRKAAFSFRTAAWTCSSACLRGPVPRKRSPRLSCRM